MNYQVQAKRRLRNSPAIKTHKEIAAQLNISTQAVHQIEQRALAKLRRLLWREKLELEGAL